MEKYLNSTELKKKIKHALNKKLCFIFVKRNLNRSNSKLM